MNITTPPPWHTVDPTQAEKPLPLRSYERADDYPIHHLPDIIRNAVEEVAGATQAPVAMIVASALSVVSASIQAHVSVQRDESLRGPASLYLMTIGSSGERKSTCDAYFMRALREWEAEQKEQAKPLLAQYRAAVKTWDATDAGYQEAIRKAAKDGALTTLDPKYVQHELDHPAEPRVPEVIRMDDTPEALAVALSKWPVAAILSAEAGLIFGAHGMNPDSVVRNLGQLNAFWGGERVKRVRTTAQSVDIEGMRVTVGLMVQQEVLDNFMGKAGVLARGIGYLARFLFCNPESTQGARFYREPSPGMPALQAFAARARHLLDFPATVDDDGRLTTGTLCLDAEAKRIWVGFHDEIEEQLAFGREFYDVRDVASKAAENAARLACCLFAFSKEPGNAINSYHMLSGTGLMRWYLREALRFFKQAGIPPALRNAELLEDFLRDYLREHKQGKVNTRLILQQGPNRLRSKEARDAALDVLVAHHRAHVWKDGKQELVTIHPSVLKGEC